MQQLKNTMSLKNDNRYFIDENEFNQLGKELNQKLRYGK